MKLDTNISEEAAWVIRILCFAIVVCVITCAIWRYNVTAVKLYTENNYEEVSDKGASIVYWRKVK